MKSRFRHRGLHKLKDKFRMKQYKLEQAVIQQKEYSLNQRWMTYIHEGLMGEEKCMGIKISKE